MNMKSLVLASSLALAPALASAATVVPLGNGAFVGFMGSENVVLPDPFNLADGPVLVTGGIFAGNQVDGSLAFGIFSDPSVAAASGSIQVNLIGAFDGLTESFAFFVDGVEQIFTQNPGSPGDFAANFMINFTDATDISKLFLTFENFDQGDGFTVNVSNVSAVPLPASALLLMAALGGLGVAVRRRKPESV